MEHSPVADGARSLGGRPRGQGSAQRLASTREFIGYTEEDEGLVRATRETVLASLDVIVRALDARLLSHRETAIHFARADGRTDRERVEAHRASLKEWLTLAIEAPLDAQLSAYLVEVGRAHTGRGREPEARVQARYLLATIGFLQTELIGVLDSAIDERKRLIATITAWSKLLMIHLDLFLAVYARVEGKAHWY